MHSGTPSLRTTELLIFFCKGARELSGRSQGRRPQLGLTGTGALDRGRERRVSACYLHEGLETLVLGVQVFEVVHRLVVLATELAICLLQAFCILA